MVNSLKRQAGRPGTTKRYMISPLVKKSVALGARRGPARPPGLPGPVLGSGTEGCGAAVACGASPTTVSKVVRPTR